MIIGITGGTGSGKTTLLQMISSLGGKILDCDAIYHRLLQENQSLLQNIEARFPGTVSGGCLDRKKLGGMVFTDQKALQDLNRITHGAVREEVLRQLEEKPSLAAIDAIGLFEGGLATLCDVTVAVLAPAEQRVRRLMARDGITEAYARKRIAAQHEDAWFREKCGYILENNGTPEAFRSSCLAFMQELNDIDKEKQL